MAQAARGSEGDQTGAPNVFAGMWERIDWARTLLAFALVFVLSIVLGAAISAIMYAISPSSGSITEELGPALISSHVAVFLAYLAGMIVLRRTTYGYPVLHAAVLLLLGAIVTVGATILDAVFGFPLEQMLPGRFHDAFGAVQFVMGPWWIIPAVGLPAALMGISLAPQKGEPFDDPMKPNTGLDGV